MPIHFFSSTLESAKCGYFFVSIQLTNGLKIINHKNLPQYINTKWQLKLIN